VSSKIRETSKRRPWPDPGWSAIRKKSDVTIENKACSSLQSKESLKSLRASSIRDLRKVNKINEIE
jgi:hypothetical protein